MSWLLRQSVPVDAGVLRPSDEGVISDSLTDSEIRNLYRLGNDYERGKWSGKESPRGV